MRGRGKLLDLPLAPPSNPSCWPSTSPGPAQVWLLLLRGDHELNEIQGGQAARLAGFRFATETGNPRPFGCKPGYLGPIKTARPVHVVADRTVANMAGFVCGANREDYHYQGANWGATCPNPAGRGPAQRGRGDPSPDGKGALSIQRGIEVGRVLPGHQIARKRSRPLSWTTTASRPCCRWAATGSASPASWARPSSRTTTPAASSGRRASPYEVVICPVGWGQK